MNDSKKCTGRTERMLQEARRLQAEEKQVIVCALHKLHARQLLIRLGSDSATADLPAIRVVPFDELTFGNNYHPARGWSHYDYATNTFPKTGNAVCLIDHAVLEQRLADVNAYLRVTAPIADVHQWMIDTSRVTAWMGRRVYFVTDDDALTVRAKESLQDYNVSVERPEMLGNLDLVTLTMSAHPNCQVYVDPKMMQRLFRGAINEITRWDE